MRWNQAVSRIGLGVKPVLLGSVVGMLVIRLARERRVSERRLATLVAGVGFLLVGVIVSSLPAGGALGVFSFVAGALLVVITVLGLIADRRASRAGGGGQRAKGLRRGPEQRTLAAIPNVDLVTWSDDSPWGTTPWGITSRITATAIATASITVIGGEGLGVGEMAFASIALVIAFTFFYLLPWMIERGTRPRTLIPRRQDAALLIPSIVVTVLVASIASTVLPAPVGWALAGVQLVWGVGVGLVLTARRREGHTATGDADATDPRPNDPVIGAPNS